MSDPELEREVERLRARKAELEARRDAALLARQQEQEEEQKQLQLRIGALKMDGEALVTRRVGAEGERDRIRNRLARAQQELDQLRKAADRAPG